jgi:hypothetical protein
MTDTPAIYRLVHDEVWILDAVSKGHRFFTDRYGEHGRLWQVIEVAGIHEGHPLTFPCSTGHSSQESAEAAARRLAR